MSGLGSLLNMSKQITLICLSFSQGNGKEEFISCRRALFMDQIRMFCREDETNMLCCSCNQLLETDLYTAITLARSLFFSIYTSLVFVRINDFMI